MCFLLLADLIYNMSTSFSTITIAIQLFLLLDYIALSFCRLAHNFIRNQDAIL